MDLNLQERRPSLRDPKPAQPQPCCLHYNAMNNQLDCLLTLANTAQSHAEASHKLLNVKVKANGRLHCEGIERNALDDCKSSLDVKYLLELYHEFPVITGQFVLEVQFQEIDGLP